MRDDMGTLSETDFGYTSQRSLPDTGLMDYNARFYDPSLNRFLQPDTLISSTANPQSWNRYAYVLNNPINFDDPSGHKACDDEFGCENLSKPVPLPTPDDGSYEVSHNSGGKPSKDQDKRHDNKNPILPIDTPTPPTPSLTGTPPTAQSSLDDDFSPIVSIMGGVLLIQLGILDGALGYGIAAVAIAALTVPGAQIGLIGELALIPMEIISLDLTVYAAQMAYTGSTEHDPLLLVHTFSPEFMPYEP